MGLVTEVNFIMLSAPPRQAPPMRLSRSLEGLEKVIPPGASHPPARSDLHLNKPLPAKPLPQAPDLDFDPDLDLPGRTALSAWSDDSSFESFADHSDPKDSTESFPIFVSSGSDNLDDPPVESTLDDLDLDLPDTRPPSPARSSIALNAFLSEERYGPVHHPTHVQNKIGTNHYFREKKWDFFPELATPSALGLSSFPAPAKGRKSNGRLNLPGLDFGRNRSRWNSENPGFSLAHGVRDSIRSYVSRTLSKENKPKRHRPVTAPSLYPSKYDSSHQALSLTDRSLGEGSSRQNSLDTYEESGDLSVCTESSMNDHSDDSRPGRRHKQLAVPLSPYQKYGTSIWDKPGGPKKAGHHRVGFPKHPKQFAKTPKLGSMFSSSAPSLSLPRSPTQQSSYVKALHDGTTHVRDALDDAKRKMTASKADRRREQLKSRIKLVGPVSPYAQAQVDPWI